MKKSYLSVFIVTLLSLTTANTSLFSQLKYNKNIADSERFSAGVLIGWNGSQIDGDYQVGFDKYGITGGIRGIARITSRLDFNIEMLYSKKGSKIFPNRAATQVNPKKDRIIDLTYIDAPIYFKWLLKEQASIWHIEVGGIYSRLTDSKITETIIDGNREFSYEVIEPDFNKDDLLFMAGLGYTWASGFALNLRYAIGVNKFYLNEDFIEQSIASPNTRDVEFLRNYYYSINLSYTIFQREIKNKRRR